MVLRSSPMCKCILSIYLLIPTTLPPLTWVTINHYINHKVVLFPILNDGHYWICSHLLYHLSYQPLTIKHNTFRHSSCSGSINKHCTLVNCHRFLSFHQIFITLFLTKFQQIGPARGTFINDLTQFEDFWHPPCLSSKNWCLTWKFIQNVTKFQSPSQHLRDVIYECPLMDNS